MTLDIQASIEAVRDRFPDLRILVVGDLMLDKYIWGSCNRISPEAPVPVVRVRNRTEALGGAANAALNVSSLGVRAMLAGFVGSDENGQKLKDLCGQAGIDSHLITMLAGYETTTKTRVLADKHQMLRIDEEVTSSRTEDEAVRLLKGIAKTIEGGGLAAVILSDYAKGTCTPYFCQELIGLCRSHHVQVFVDPKGREAMKYAGATGLKPNRSEMHQLSEALNLPTDDLVEAARQLRDRLGLEFLAVTLGAKGILMLDDAGVTEIPALAREVFDVSGAGDTVIATMSCALADGFARTEAIGLANVAAGQVVMKAGTAPILRDELLAALQGRALDSLPTSLGTESELVQRVLNWRAGGESVGAVWLARDFAEGDIRELDRISKQWDRLVALSPTESLAAIGRLLRSVDAVFVVARDHVDGLADRLGVSLVLY